MRSSLERIGWGTGLQDLASPTAATDGAAARALAFWSFITACSSRALALRVQAIFHRPETPLVAGPGAHARLLSLLDRLMRVELPALTRAVRIETTTTSEWMRAPQGGRVDAVETLRVSGMAPKSWLVRRTERRVDTPVNQFAAAILRTTTAQIEQVSSLYRHRGLVVPEWLGAAGLGLQRFLRDHLLGGIAVPAGTSPETYRLAAARRAAELARIASLVRWWDALQEIELSALQLAFEAGDVLTDIDTHGSYEMAVALALACALAERGHCDADHVALRFTDRDRHATLELGAADPTSIIGRGLTARLEFGTDSGWAATWLVEARYSRTELAKPHLSHLAQGCRAVGDNCRGLLLTPGPPGPVPLAWPVRWAAMPVTANVSGLVIAWIDLLGTLERSSTEQP